MQNGSLTVNVLASVTAVNANYYTTFLTDSPFFSNAAANIKHTCPANVHSSRNETIPFLGTNVLLARAVMLHIRYALPEEELAQYQQSARCS